MEWTTLNGSFLVVTVLHRSGKVTKMLLGSATKFQSRSPRKVLAVATRSLSNSASQHQQQPPPSRVNDDMHLREVVRYAIARTNC